MRLMSSLTRIVKTHGIRKHQRWESRSATHELYWLWLEESRKVLVITCFGLEE